MSNEKIFADGFFFKRSQNAPDWVAGKLSLNLEKAIDFAQQHAKKVG